MSDKQQEVTMGRPSVAEERVTTILAATGRCIARHGIDGTTLEKVAAESGMSRSHVRHYVGNRADLIALFRSRILERYAPPDLGDAQAAGISATELALAFLFDQEADLDDYAAIDAVLAAARHDDSLHADVLSAYTRLEAFVAAAIRADHPRWADERVTATASQVLMLNNGHATMASVGLASVRLGAARALAAQLMEPPSSMKGTSS
jgi:AcrR family transcriptional regulator